VCQKTLRDEENVESPFSTLRERRLFLSIRSVANAPLLLGKKPPFLPLLRIEVLGPDNGAAWTEQVHWFDAVFLANSLAEAVVSHAEGVHDMLEAGQIALPPGDFSETLQELRVAVDQLGRLFDRQSG
jgi:hypothetical protein